MRTAIFAYTDRGRDLEQKLGELLCGEGETVETGLSAEEAFRTCGVLIFIGAAGIAVRKIAPFVKDKFTDPAVVSVDEFGRFAVPLLSGHAGGANDMARRLAALLGAVPVISTATDLNHRYAVDVFAGKNGLVITDRVCAKEISAALLRGERIGFRSELPVKGELPAGLIPEEAPAAAEYHIRIAADADGGSEEKTLVLIPRVFCLGVGCRRGTDPEKMASAAREFLKRQHVDPSAVAAVASIDLKREEPAILKLPERLAAGSTGAGQAVPSAPAALKFFTAEELNAVPGEFPASDFVKKTTGTDNVCMRAAAAVFPEIAVPKEAGEGMTFSLSRERKTLFFPEETGEKGKPVFITGGAYQGKHAFAGRLLKNGTVSEILDAAAFRKETEELTALFLNEGELSAELRLKETADRICAAHPGAAVILRAEGNGVVPAERRARAAREVSGRLGCLFSARASEVWVLECGIPRRIK